MRERCPSGLARIHRLSTLAVALTLAAPVRAEQTSDSQAQPVADAVVSVPAVAPATTANNPPTANNQDDLAWGDPWGDSHDELRAMGLSFRFMAQVHYRQTFASPSDNPDVYYRGAEEILARHNDGWDLNRLFFRITARPVRYVGLKVLIDMAEWQNNDVGQSVKQAYAELKFIPKHLHLLAGVLKLPYSIMELDPITAYEFTKMGDTDDFVKSLGYAGRDAGAELWLAPLSKPRYFNLALGAFRGNAKDENAVVVGALGARAETEAIRGLRLGFDWIYFPKTHTYLNALATGSETVLPNSADSPYPRSRTWLSGQAFSADITYRLGGFMLRTEVLTGTRVDYDTQHGAHRFAALWASVAYRFPLGPVQLQPALRAEWLDANYGNPNGMHRQLTAGIATHFTNSTRILVDLTRTDVESGSPYLDQPEPPQAVPYRALSNTCATLQLQTAL